GDPRHRQHRSRRATPSRRPAFCFSALLSFWRRGVPDTAPARCWASVPAGSRWSTPNHAHGASWPAVYYFRPRMPKFFIKTYGCQMNERDSEEVAHSLVSRGYEQALHETDADVILL